jgi:hypothetical protein
MDTRGGQTMTNAERLARTRISTDTALGAALIGDDDLARIYAMQAARHGDSLLADENVSKASDLGSDAAWCLRHREGTVGAIMARKAAHFAVVALEGGAS